MAEDKSPRKVRVKKPEGESADLFTDEPVKTPWEKDAEKSKAAEADLEYEPAPETEMDFMTVEEEKTQKKNVTIGVVLGILLAALLIGGYIYYNQSGKIQETPVSTTTTTILTTGAEIETTTRTYVTQQLTIHKDKNGVWRSYAGLEPTVGYTGVVGNDTGWWYVENDLVNFKYNGIASNDYGTWLIENGKVNEKYSGKYVYNGLLYHIDGGKVVRSEKLTTTSRKPTSATSSTSATTAADNSTGTTASTTSAHEHKWVAVYDGDAIVEDMNRFCQCPECGLKFKDRELLESHAYAMQHTLSEDPADDAFNTGSDKQEVIVGYTNSDNTYWVCTICGKTTRNAEEAGVGL